MAPVVPKPKKRSARDELRELRDLWKALNAAIEHQEQDVRNDIADRYRLHPLYAKHFPEDHAIARQERTNVR
jgi:hypothetical protein